MSMDRFFYGTCGHEWEIAIHGGRCPTCLPKPLRLSNCQATVDGAHEWNFGLAVPVCFHCGVPVSGQVQPANGMVEWPPRIAGLKHPSRQDGKSFAASWLAEGGLKKPTTSGEVLPVSWSHPPNFTIYLDEAPTPLIIAAERLDELRKGDPSLNRDMLTAGIAAMRGYDDGDDAGEVAAVWRAMSVHAPVELVTEAERAAQTTIRILSEAGEHSRAENAELKRQIMAMSDALKRAMGRILTLSDALMRANDGDSATDIHDRAERLAKDILGGRVTRTDRHTVQEALKGAPKEAPAIPDFRRVGDGDRRRIGG